MPVIDGASAAASGATLQSYLNEIRTDLEDWAYEDELQADLSASGLSIEVRDGTRFRKGHLLELGDELLLVADDSTTNTVSVIRHQRGTSPVGHNVGTRVLHLVNWPDSQFKRWVNRCLVEIFPKIYVRTSTTLTPSSTYLYTINDDDLVDPRNQIESMVATDGSTRINLSSSTVELVGNELYIPINFTASYTITVNYVVPLPAVDELNDTIALPSRARDLPVLYVMYKAQAQKEAKRSRFSAYQTRQDEAANPSGEQARTAKFYMNEYRELLMRSRMGYRRFFGF